ncbi:MAG: thioredoxin domain-containing protein [Deltaproteobacteria bacterium]|nr:thioredoxin domain-containing protein [Deltaproteobacteria bacterium]
MPNRLADSTSPYLRQHADNPVDWYEWGPEALARAKTEGRPILLSVGYSSCHWCHVMAHESFEDEATAAVMNERFINIKVDREERPDIDTIYQRVVQLMGQGGGWPLTVFLTPDQHPFYGGTYFPPVPKYGRPSFSQLLDAIHRMFHDDPDQVVEHATSFREGFEHLATIIDQESAEASGDPVPPDPAALELAVQRLLTRLDPQWGGFGRQPKFPNPSSLELLAAVARREGADTVVVEARRGLANTLEKMYRGGIYDHLRGGFARYSTDQRWLVPHFEKMLYDNAQLLPLYAEAAAQYPEREHLHRVVTETLEYLAADMRTEQGTFYAATDADSEGVEGKYFCWTPTQVSAVLDDDALAQTLCTVYDVTEAGNFEHGWSILNLPRPRDEHARAMGLSPTQLDEQLARAQARLLEHRYGRVAPHRDDKVLTSWNALLVSGLARTAMALRARGDRPGAERAQALALGAAIPLLDQHVDDQGRVFRAAFEGRVHTRGVLDDVAYLGRACLDLHELTLDPRWLPPARALASHILHQYMRPGGDGFYFTALDAEALIDRTESQHDGPIPSGLGVTLELLLRLDHADMAPPITTETIRAVLDRFGGATAQPQGYASLLGAARHAAPNAMHVTLRGPAPDDPSVRALAATVYALRVRLPDALSLHFTEAPSVDAVVCRGHVCRPPVSDPEALHAELAG